MPRTRDDVIVERSKLGRLTRLAEGGQAVVYKVDDGSPIPGVDGPLVYKAYRADILQDSGYALWASMPALILRPDSMSSEDRALVKQFFVWPQALVVEKNRALGILMKLIPSPYFFDLKLSKGRTKERIFDGAQLMVPESKKSRRGIPSASAVERMRLFLTTLSAVALLHRNGLIIGDFSENNLIFTNPDRIPQGNERHLIPKFMDIDGFRMGSTQPAVKQANTNGWFVPENVSAAREAAHLELAGASRSLTGAAKARASVQNSQSDVFKLGLFAIRLFHVPTESDPTLIANVYTSKSAPSNIKRVLANNPAGAAAILAMTNTDPKARPTVSDILATFRR